MKERFKSFLLLVLVATSLIQTYLLAYSKPYYELVDEAEYIEPELIGTRVEAADLIYPNDIVLHLGEGEHVVLYPQNVFYEEIFNKVRMRSVGGFRQIERRSVDWAALRDQHRGVEIRFHGQIPAPILENIMQIDGVFPNNEESFDKIWIATNETGEEVRTFFFNTKDGVIYEVTRADLTSKDVEQFVGFGEQYQPKYTALPVGSSGRALYVPLSDLEMVRFKLQIDTFTPEQLQNNLFVNPGITRKLMERDGTEIYTDGKRGLQIDHDRRWMSYSDPIAPINMATDLPNHLLSAVQFVNQHGGWNGTFRIETYAGATDQEYIFRQYYGQYPIIGLYPQSFGVIRVVMNGGIANLYERSLVSIVHSGTEREEAHLPGGDLLLELVRNHSNLILMDRMYPAYQPVVHDDHIVLTPVWIAEFVNGTKEILF